MSLRVTSKRLVRTAALRPAAPLVRAARFASGRAGKTTLNATPAIFVAGALAAGAALALRDEEETVARADGAKPAAPAVDYAAVRKAIADKLDVENFDDGSYGPLLVRLAWHAAGTYDKNSNTGGSDGATMRFPPESTDGANAGLKIARDLLEPIKAKFPGLTYADLWTLAGAVAIEEMGGPKIPWRPGRRDAVDDKTVPPNGRLPDAAQGEKHIRDVFYRMGFNDQEIVALIGAHTLGRCHTDRSGFTGPWTRAPTTFSNEFFRVLTEYQWTEKKWNGPKQYQDPTGDLMMLPADLALIKDPEFKKYVELYAKNEEQFRQDFAKAFSKLLELGVKAFNAPAAAAPAAAAAAPAKKDEKPAAAPAKKEDKPAEKSWWAKITGK